MDNDGNHYFIEMNTRIQVEHTVTEMVTGVDSVQAQILIAQGYSLDSQEIGIQSQKDISMRGAAIQCRITTEDPVNGFAPDTGKIDIYRTGSGFGIRLDGDSGFTGAVVSPYYDSLLVKITSWGRNFQDARTKAYRALSRDCGGRCENQHSFFAERAESSYFCGRKVRHEFYRKTSRADAHQPRGDGGTSDSKISGE